MKRFLTTLVAACLCASVLAGCAVEPRGGTKDAKRKYVLRSRDAFLEKADKIWPGLKTQCETAPGYAYYDMGIMRILLGAASGYGVVVDNGKGWETVVKPLEISLGAGLELSNMQAIVVFHTEEALLTALDGRHGWNLGGAATAAFEFGNFGGDSTGWGHTGDTTTYADMNNGFGLHASIIWTKTEPNGLLN